MAEIMSYIFIFIKERQAYLTAATSSYYKLIVLHLKLATTTMVKI